MIGALAPAFIETIAIQTRFNARVIPAPTGISSARQFHAPLFWIRVLAEEKRGMADGADAHATTLIGNLGAFDVTLVPIGSEETQLYELVRAECLLQLLQKFGRKPLATDLEDGVEFLAEAAQVRTLRAGERKFVHGPRMTRMVPDGKAIIFRRVGPPPGLSPGSHVEEIKGQLAPFPPGQFAQRERTEALAVECEDGHALRRKHPPHLVVAPLEEREFGLAG